MQKTLLIIDDDSTLRLDLNEFFKGKGYAVMEAGDGKAGVELIKSGKPDAILLDIMMPEMDGMAVIKEVAAMDPDMLGHITLMTNSSSMKYLSDAIDLGVFRYVLKGDMGLEQIFKIVESTIRK